MRSTTAAVAVAVGLALTACGSDDRTVVVTDPQDVQLDRSGSGFPSLDADGDSALDRDEIPELADRSAFEEWDADADSEVDRDEIAGNAFALWDANSNGAIDVSEWESGAELFFPDTAQVVPLEDVDGDGDSELDEDEFGEQLDYTALGETWSDGVLDEERFKQAYFELYDRDDDGTVDEQEWRRAVARLGAPLE
jgi:Ca2+-binding EF-hand superfamily protein